MPCFFQENLDQNRFTITSEESKHIAKSLRLKEGDNILISDGRGTLAQAILTNVHTACCEAEIVERFFHDKSNLNKLHLAVAPTKNPDRMEWLVEKAVEIGVSQISFIICDRSERKHIDLNRLNRVAIAALKQSQGVWLPEMKTVGFSQFLNKNTVYPADKFIACCDIDAQSIEIAQINYQSQDAIFLIGPEGDFTPQEVLFAKARGFQSITLGKKTLRTETAALFVGCCYAAFRLSN
jgi:16S rRNA (uracil1498-N3)-methyltransferase